MGTILLLTITVGLFSVVAISVYNLLPFNPAPSTDIICQVNGDNIILTHQGGDALSLDTKIGFSTFNGSTKYIVVKDYLNTTDKTDGKWSVGEKIVYPNPNLLQNQIRVTVIDPSSNSFILSVTVPVLNSISVATLNATGITMNSANLPMHYDLPTKSGSVRFTYRPSDGGWINTSWSSKSGSGLYNTVLTGLSPVKLYYFKAQLLYNSTIIEGNQKSFTTLVKPNNPPIFSNPSPTNSSIGVILQSKCAITINDADGDIMTLRWYENTTGSWVQRQANSSCSNGTYRWTYSQANTNIHSYWWKVVCNDGKQNITAIYKFTTKVNNPPIVSGSFPTNGSMGLSITTSSVAITIQDPEGDLFNWIIATSPNVGSNSGTGASNGTKSCAITGLTYATTYTWTVKANDGYHWTNRSYVFTIGICPVINTSVNKINPSVISVNPLTITATGNSDLDNVTLYYRWSDDNISWNGGLNEKYKSIDSNTSNVDSSADKGVETNFPNAKGTARDGNSMTIQEQNTGTMAAQEWLNCNVLGSTYAGWTRTGTSPYVSAKDYATNYVYTASNGAQIGWFDFPSTTLTGTLTVNISIYCQNVDGANNDGADVYVDYTGSGSGTYVGRVGQHTAWQYDIINLGTHTISEVNNLRAYLLYYKSGPADIVLIDHIRMGVNQPNEPNYQLDFEYQWTAAVYNQANKQVCLYIVSHTGTENLLVNYWTGSAWSSLGTITTTGWSNFTATGLTASTYTIQLKGATESGDSAQDSWNIDVIMLHTWNTTGGSHGQNWIIWSDATNPDTSLPWSWNFNFPKAVGYYEFFTIGKDIGHCGGDIESAPASADARCRKT